MIEIWLFTVILKHRQESYKKQFVNCSKKDGISKYLITKILFVDVINETPAILMIIAVGSRDEYETMGYTIYEFEDVILDE